MTWHVYLVGCWILLLVVILQIVRSNVRKERQEREYLENFAKICGIQVDPTWSNFELRQRIKARMRMSRYE